MRTILVMMALVMPVHTVADEAANKALVKAMFDQAWNQGRFDVVDEGMADDAMFHFRGASRPMNPAATRQVISSWRETFPDLEFLVEDILAEGDMVAARLRFSGTQQGRWKDIEPAGRRFEVTGMMFFRFEDGKLVEIWEDFDEYGMRRQLRAASDGK